MPCKNRALNVRLQKYRDQQHRGTERKVAAIVALGGGCIDCGYNRNVAALVFHHRDPSQKAFMLNSRTFANMASDRLQSELAKCDLLCHNCHHERHYPQFTDLLG